MNYSIIKDNENEKASLAYLMPLFIFFISLPIPIVNLIMVVIYYLINRKGAYTVRWHSMQCMLSQVPICLINSVCFSWTIRIIFFDYNLTLPYYIYLSVVILANLIETIATIIAAIKVRKGNEVRWIVFATITDKLIKK